MKYIFAIDETGDFFFNSWSYACGVLIKRGENDLRKAYQTIYKEFGFATPVPNDAKSLLQTTDDINDKARFHYNKMESKQKEILKKNLLPFVKEIYISKGKPLLFANNQNWWLIAITVIIRDFLRNTKFEKDDEIEIWIDNRNEKVFGVDEKVDFKEYHDNIKAQIKNYVKDYVNKLKFNITFSSDTSSFFINLADIVCGLANNEDLKDKKTECYCSSFNSFADPVVYKNKNPFLALSLMLQKIGNQVERNEIDKNLDITKEILKNLRAQTVDYELIWNMFYDFLKFKIDERSVNSNLVAVKEFVKIFLDEFNTPNSREKIKANKCLDLMVLFTEYFSHIGDINIPFDRKSFVEELQKCDKDSETRLLRKWEKLVSYTLRESQIYFNAYNFESANENLVDIWDKHTNLLSALKDVLEKKDEPTTALISSLGQSLAFKGEFKEAKDYFELSMDYAIKSNNLSISHLFNIYHKEENIKECRALFEQIAEKTAENYAKDKEFEDSWTLIAYCKLRALELYVNKQTNLPAIDLCALSKYNSEYPFPMVMKWEGVALYLENKEGNKKTIEKYFSEAIANLLNENNEFVIKTLALPIIQCYALVNNQNPYHRQYNTYLRELKNTSKYFEEYVEKTSPLLNEIKNESNIWERALLLPFFYA